MTPAPPEEPDPESFSGRGGGRSTDLFDALHHYTDGAEVSATLASGPPDGGVPALPDAGPAPEQVVPPAPADAGIPTAAPGAEEEAPSVARKPGRGDTPAQNAEWKDVKDAATDPAAREKLDIGWIGDESLGMNPRVRESIDASYGDAKHGKPRKKAVDASLRQLDRAGAAQLDATRDAIAAERNLRRDPRTKRYRRADLAEIEGDPRFVDRRAELAQQRREAEAQARAQYDSSVSAKRPAESVANPDAAKFALEEGKMRSRTNFMSWATYLMGDPEKVKRHFLGIQATAGDPNMLLAESAGRRFELAKAQFEKENPGYTLPNSGVAHSMRDLHEQRMGLGMLGHAMGLAVDYAAYENPNLKGAKGEQPGLNA